MRAELRLVLVGLLVATLVVPTALAPPAAAAVAPCSRGDVALTFDDGPRSPHTTSILDTLKAKKAPATFFVIGSVAASRPSMLTRMHAEGHQVGNHSWSHPRLSSMSAAGIRRELTRTNDELRRHGLPRPVVMRPPYGATNGTVRAVASDLGLAHVLWTIDTNDWRTGRTASQIRTTVLANLHSGANVLMHDGTANAGATATALPGMIDGIRARGYCVGTLNAAGKVVPAVPRLRVGDAKVTEGAAGTTSTLTFPVTLSVPTSRRVTVAFATANGSAAAGVDYSARTGTLTIPPGATSGTITVRVLGDGIDEHDETVRLALSSPAGATIARGAATGTVVDDDAPSSLRVLDTRAAETAGLVRVTVELNRVSGKRITAKASTAAKTSLSDPTAMLAVAGRDYTAATSALVFEPGVRTRTVTVPLLDRPVEQKNRELAVVASSVTNATVARAQSTVTITDMARPFVTAAPTDPSGVTPGDVATVRLTLSSPTPRPVTVIYSTGAAGDQAVSGADYRATSGTASFAAGQTVKEVAIPTLAGAAFAGDRTFTLALSAPVNARLATPSAATVTLRGDPLEP